MKPVVVKDDFSETIVECDVNNGADKLSGLSISHEWEDDDGMRTRLFFNKENAIAIRDYINYMIQNELFAEDKPDSAKIREQLTSVEQRRLFNKYLSKGRRVWVVIPPGKSVDDGELFIVPFMGSQHLEGIYKAPVLPDKWTALGHGEVTDFHVETSSILVQDALKCKINEEMWLQNAKR